MKFFRHRPRYIMALFIPAIFCLVLLINSASRPDAGLMTTTRNGVAPAHMVDYVKQTATVEPNPVRSESLTDYLNQITQTTGIQIAGPGSDVMSSSAAPLTVISPATSSSATASEAATDIAQRYNLTLHEEKGWEYIIQPPVPDPSFLPAEKKTWSNVVALLQFQQSFSVDQLTQMRDQGGYLSLNALSDAQQSQFWQLQKAVNLAGPLNYIKTPFDPNKLMLNVDCCADVRLENPDGTPLPWLTLFEYTGQGQEVTPKVEAGPVNPQLAQVDGVTQVDISPQKSDSELFLADDVRLQKQVTFLKGNNQQALDWADQVQSATGCRITLHPDLRPLRVFISGRQASGAQVIKALALVLRATPRRIGDEVYLAKTAKPIGEWTSAERLLEGLSEAPNVDSELQALRHDVRHQLMFLPFNRTIPFPESWFSSALTIPFRDLPTSAQAWLREVFRTHPRATTDYLATDPQKMNIRFSNDLWISGYYTGGYNFTMMVDDTNYALPNPVNG